MPIPPFTLEGILPPFLGEPGGSEYSPYSTTMLEICHRWQHNPERRKILKGLLSLRGVLRGMGVVQGFQWLDGSFVEECETIRHRSPADIDVVTFYLYQKPADLPEDVAQLIPIVGDREATKDHFHVDHIPVPLSYDPPILVNEASYWTQVFSHRRDDFVHKGMLQVDLMDEPNDILAKSFLHRLP